MKNTILKIVVCVASMCFLAACTTAVYPKRSNYIYTDRIHHYPRYYPGYTPAPMTSDRIHHDPIPVPPGPLPPSPIPGDRIHHDPAPVQPSPGSPGFAPGGSRIHNGPVMGMTR